MGACVSWMFVKVTFKMCVVFEGSDVRTSELCFYIDSAKLCKVLLLFNCPLTYQNWNIYENFLNLAFDKEPFWLVNLPGIVFGHMFIKECWQVATRFLTKLASLNFSGLFSLIYHCVVQSPKLKKNFFRKLFLIMF